MEHKEPMKPAKKMHKRSKRRKYRKPDGTHLRNNNKRKIKW